MYVVVGWLAVQIAFGEPAGNASGSGALREMAQQPFGEVILWVACVGFVALAIWKTFEAVVGHKEEDGGKRVLARVMSAGKAIVFVVLAVLAFQTVTGSSGGGSSEDGYTAKIMKLPFGPALVVALGLAIIGYGVYSVYKGLSDKWKKSLEIAGPAPATSARPITDPGQDGLRQSWVRVRRHRRPVRLGRLHP